VRGEQALAPEPDALDQPPDEDVGGELPHRAGGRVVEVQEPADAVAGLWRDLRRLERGLQGRDHVELAPARDRRAARQVDRAQLDRRPAERPDGRGRVGGVGEQAQPGDHVADLRALEERAALDQAEGDAALLQGGGDRPRPGATVRDRDADPIDGDLLGRQRRLDLARHRLGLGAIVGAAPEGHGCRRAARAASPLVAIGNRRQHRVCRIE
jgi:hypothetical protein